MLKDGKQCKLQVVKMKGWKRKMDYTQTGLQWVPSSPHIPHPRSAFFYPVSGILGGVGLYVYRSRLHDSVPDVRCPVGGSRETCQKPERAERTGYRLPTDVPETVLLRR